MEVCTDKECPFDRDKSISVPATALPRCHFHQSGENRDLQGATHSFCEIRTRLIGTDSTPGPSGRDVHESVRPSEPSDCSLRLRRENAVESAVVLEFPFLEDYVPSGRERKKTFMTVEEDDARLAIRAPPALQPKKTDRAAAVRVEPVPCHERIARFAERKRRFTGLPISELPRGLSADRSDGSCRLTAAERTTERYIKIEDAHTRKGPIDAHRPKKFRSEGVTTRTSCPRHAAELMMRPSAYAAFLAALFRPRNRFQTVGRGKLLGNNKNAPRLGAGSDSSDAQLESCASVHWIQPAGCRRFAS